MLPIATVTAWPPGPATAQTVLLRTLAFVAFGDPPELAGSYFLESWLTPPGLSVGFNTESTSGEVDHAFAGECQKT